MSGTLTLAAEIQEQMRAFALVYARVGTVALFLPPMGEASLPARVRLVLGLVLAAIVWPLVGSGPAIAAAAPLGFGMLFLSETLVGLGLGVLVRLAVVALQICGTIIAQVSSLSQLMGIPGSEPVPVIGHILVLAGLALAMMADLHVQLATMLADSYAAVPQGSLLDPGRFAGLLVAHVAAVFALALALAAPFVIAALIYNLALGVINRAMPQLMVVLVGAPAIIAATLVLLALTAPLLLQVWLAAFQRVLADPFGGP